MTEIVNDPYADVDWSSDGQYKAQHHTHPEGTHAFDDPAHEVIDWYDARGFDVLTVNAVGDADAWPWTELASLGDDQGFDWEDRYPIGTHGDAPSQSQQVDMIAVEGREQTGQHPNADDDLEDHHILTLFTGAKLDTSSNDPTIDEILQAVEDDDGLAVFAHPTRYVVESAWNEYTSYIEDYGCVLGFEAMSKEPNRSWVLSDPNQRSIQLWDRLAWTQSPTSVFGLANDDGAQKDGSTSNVRWTNLIMEDLTHENVRNAYEQGQFYWSARERWQEGSRTSPFEEETTAPTIDDIEHDTDAQTITVTASDYDEIRWITTDRSVVKTGETVDYGEANVGPHFRAELVHYRRNIPQGITSTQPWLTDVDTVAYRSRSKASYQPRSGGQWTMRVDQY